MDTENKNSELLDAIKTLNNLDYQEVSRILKDSDDGLKCKCITSAAAIAIVKES